MVAAKVALNRARKARHEVQERADMLGAQIIQLYGNLLTDEAHQSWEKIVKVQTTLFPWKASVVRCIKRRQGKPGSPSWIAIILLVIIS